MKTRCGAEGQVRQQMEPANQENSRFRPLGFRQPDVRTGVATTFHRHNAHCANRNFNLMDLRQPCERPTRSGGGVRKEQSGIGHQAVVVKDDADLEGPSPRPSFGGFGISCQVPPFD